MTAIDLTHDPAAGADMVVISEQLRLSKDPRVKYVIFNSRFFSPKTGWTWQKYSGLSPHDKHMHVSVQGSPPLADDRAQWGIIEEDEMSLTDCRIQVAAAWFAASGEWMSPTATETRQARLTRLGQEVFNKQRTASQIATFAVRIGPSDPIEAMPAWVTSADLPFP